MSKKRAAGEGVTIDAATYHKLSNLLDELAFRGPKEEAIVMRIAKAAGFNEVMTRIKKLRIYAKKQGLVRAPKPKADGKAPKKRSRKGSAPQEGDGSGAAT